MAQGMQSHAWLKPILMCPAYMLNTTEACRNTTNETNPMCSMHFCEADLTSSLQEEALMHLLARYHNNYSDNSTSESTYLLTLLLLSSGQQVSARMQRRAHLFDPEVLTSLLQLPQAQYQVLLLNREGRDVRAFHLQQHWRSGIMHLHGLSPVAS